MTNEELVKALRERSVFLFPHHGESRSYDADLMHEAADAIEKLQELNAEITRRELKLRMSKPRWISVKDRLPETRTEVLVYIQPKDDKQPHPAFISLDFLESGGYWTEATQPWQYEVTHWMPLPEPPKEE